MPGSDTNALNVGVGAKQTEYSSPPTFEAFHAAVQTWC